MAADIIVGAGTADGIIVDGTTVDDTIPTTMVMPIMDRATIGTIRTIAGVTGARELASTSTSDAMQPRVLHLY